MLLTDCGSMWPVPSWIGTSCGRPRKSLCWRKLNEKRPGREETNPGTHDFSIRTPSPPSGPTGTWSMNTLSHQANKTHIELWSKESKNIMTCSDWNYSLIYSSVRQCAAMGPWALSGSIWEGRSDSNAREKPKATQRTLVQPQLGQPTEG